MIFSLPSVFTRLPRRALVIGLASAFICACSPAPMHAAEPFRIGLILPFSGLSASTGAYQLAGATLYLKQHKNMFAGRAVELLVRDDQGAPEITRRHAAELIANDHVDVLVGFGLTPLALAAAPIATAAKIPMLVSVASSRKITAASPFIVRTNLALAQAAEPMARWCFEKGYRTAATLVLNYAPGHEAEEAFAGVFEMLGGHTPTRLQVAAQTPDFASALLRVKEAHPDVLFVFVASSQSGVFFRQLQDSGLRQAGIAVTGTGDVVDEDVLPALGAAYGESLLGFVSAHPYSVLNDTAQNPPFVAAFAADNDGRRPSSLAVGAYDAMGLLDHALQKTGGAGDGQALLDALTGLTLESPRGMIGVDRQSHELVQDVFVRTVISRNGAFYNLPIARYAQIRLPPQ